MKKKRPGKRAPVEEVEESSEDDDIPLSNHVSPAKKNNSPAKKNNSPAKKDAASPKKKDTKVNIVSLSIKMYF